jgi:hypothetical protein
LESGPEKKALLKAAIPSDETPQPSMSSSVKESKEKVQRYTDFLESNT